MTDETKCSVCGLTADMHDDPKQFLFSPTPKPTSTPHTVPLEWMEKAGMEKAAKEIDLCLCDIGTEEEIQARIVAIIARHFPHWVKIEEGKPETLPELNQTVWFVDSGEVKHGRYFGVYQWWDCETQTFVSAHRVSHWMSRSLPAPPTEGETRK